MKNLNIGCLGMGKQRVQSVMIKGCCVEHSTRNSAYKWHCVDPWSMNVRDFLYTVSKTKT